MKGNKIAEYSATPDGTTDDLMSWNDNNNQSSKKKLVMEVTVL